jgi:hypothetical protein
MLCKGCGKMAMDNSCARITGEESEHPPLTSCSQKPFLDEQKKRTTHVLQNGGADKHLDLKVTGGCPYVFERKVQESNRSIP